jgi:ABC-type uncharacterized transport system involved in gliding motility auxiliary subunit
VTFVKRLLPTLNLNSKIIAFLFWVGLGITIAGLSAGIVAGTWSTVALGLVIGGLVVIGLWLLLRGLNAPPAGSSWWQQRSTQVGANAFLTTLAVFVILGGLNFLAVRAPGQLDFTEIKQFTLAPQTKQVLQALKQPVKAWVFSKLSPAEPEQQNLLAQQRSLLELYKRQNPEKFSFEVIDPDAQPGLAQKYKVRTLGELILETGDRTKTLEGTPTETNLTPALASLLRDRKLNAYIIQGHGETPPSGGKSNLSEAITELKKRDFNVNVLNLIEQKQIPDDADVAIVAGPKRPFIASEVKLLSNHLQQGKGLLLMLDPDPTKPLDQKEMGLGALLKEWGVQLDGRLVVDASGSGQMLGLGPAIPLVTQYGNHPITKEFAQGPSFYPVAQAVTVKPPSPNQTATDLIKTNPQSWAESDPTQAKLQFDAARDRQGPLTLGVAMTQKVTANPPSPEPSKPATTPSQNESKREAKLVVIGDSDFATVSDPQVLDSDLFLNTVTWLGSEQNDPSLSIRPKDLKNRRIEMSQTQWRILMLVGLGFLPLAAFGSAAYIWWRRR